MIFLSIFIFNNLNVYAETASFYEGEYIDNIYMNKYQYSTKKIFFQKARFFRKSGTNEFAYCIEPFQFFNDNSTYESTITPYNLSSYQKDRISKIAYFGYGYKNHTEPKWYAITQFMIWQTADNSGDYYFTDKLNGNRVNYFTNEIAEINSLIANYEKIPSIANKEYTTVEDWELTLQDDNNILDNYKTNNKDLIINNNSITISKHKPGTYNFTLYKEENIYNKPLIFYQSNTSQNLMKTGDLTKQEINFKLKVISTNLKIIKIDQDTKTIIPSGEGELNGAKYMLYDKNMNEIEELEIINNEAHVNNLYFGKYYLKEIEPGKGYTLDNNIYEINITEENNNIQLELENKIIEKKIIINKKYGENNNFQGEKNIEFEIYNSDNNLIKTITTNELGIAEVVLPYGKYTIIQKNTTEGYNKINPFEITINNGEEETIELKDLKIPVPNTHSDIYRNIILLILQILTIIIC